MRVRERERGAARYGVSPVWVPAAAIAVLAGGAEHVKLLLTPRPLTADVRGDVTGWDVLQRV